MKIVNNNISLTELKKMPEYMFDNLVKAVVDVKQEIMVVDAQMHCDEEELLLEQGSKQENLWGINIYPYHAETEKFIIFDSMINIRPKQNNRSRLVEDIEIQKKIRHIISKLVTLS